MTPLRLAWLNLSRRRASTVVALISIAIAIACSGIVYRLYLLSQSQFKTFVKGVDVVVGAKASSIEMLLSALDFQGEYPDFIPSNLYRSLENPSGIHFKNEDAFRADDFQNVIPIVFFAKFGRYRVIGTDQHLWNPSASSDAPALSQGEWFQNPKEVVLGSSIALHENLHRNDKIKALPWLSVSDAKENVKPIQLKVVGILKQTGSAWDQVLFTNYKDAWNVFRERPDIVRGVWGTHVLHYMLMKVKPEALPRLSNLINKGTVSQLINVEEERQNLSRFLGAGEKVALLVSLFILVLGGLAVGGVMLTKFDGMITQFAILRAIGYQVHEIFLWLLWEGLIVGAMACVLGCVLDYLMFLWLRNLVGIILASDQVVASSFYASRIVWVSALFATLVSAVLPAFQLLYQNPHEALKGV